MNRGDRREDIFEDDKGRVRFLETLGQTYDKTGWQVHAYCLMSNHFHLVVETPQPSLVAGMNGAVVRALTPCPSPIGWERGKVLWGGRNPGRRSFLALPWARLRFATARQAGMCHPFRVSQSGIEYQGRVWVR